MTRTYRSREQWSHIIEQFNDSELNVTNFCHTHNISQNAFYYWRKRFNESTPSQEQSLFVDITTPDSPSASGAPAWDIELELGPGIVLRMRQPC